MVFHHSTTFTGKNTVHKNRRCHRTHFGNQGFILLYALWVLTALSIYLAVIIKQAHNINPPGNSQLTLAISEKQTLNILQYVLSRTYSSSLPVDPRLNTYKNATLATQSNNEKNANVAFLKELLGQMGMELDLSKKDADSSNKGQSDQESSSGLIKQGALYYPKKEPFTLTVLDEQYSISISPIDARPNLNLLPTKTMARYFSILGLDKKQARRLSHVISDWVDSDNFSSNYGAEFNYYFRSYIPYKPRNSPIKGWGELYYIKDISPETINLLMDNFVLAGNRATISAKYSTPEIISVLANISISNSQKYFDFHSEGSQSISLINLIGSDDIEAIKSVAQWESNAANTLIVQIESKQSKVEGIFNKESKELFSWRFY